MAKKAKSPFPQVVYLVEEDDHGSPYFVNHESLENTVDVGGRRKVACYNFEQVLEVEGHVRIKGTS